MADKDNCKVVKPGEWEFEYELQASQVDGHHILDDIRLETILESDDNALINNDIIQSNQDIHNNDDNDSICTFKSSVSNKSDPLHNFLFSIHQDPSHINHKQYPKRKRKRSFQDMMNESIIDTYSQQHSIHSISSTQSASSESVSASYTNRHRNEEHWRWDKHIFMGNTAICFRLKGVYYPARIETVTNNYFLLKLSVPNPNSRDSICYRFKYKDYIKDRQRVIALMNASQLTETQSQSQHNIISLPQINTQPLPPLPPSEDQSTESQQSDHELNLHLSLSDDDIDGIDDKKKESNESESESDTDNDRGNNNISDNDRGNEEIMDGYESYDPNNELDEDDDGLSMNEECADTIGTRVKKRRRSQYTRSESDTTSDDESIEDYRCNHNAKQKETKRKRKRVKWKRVLSDDEDSDQKKVYDDEEDKSPNKKVKRVKKRSGQTTKGQSYVYWTQLEMNALIEGYKKYRKYENEPKFKEGVFSKIMKDKKYNKIFKKNKRTRTTIKHKWYRLNVKLKLIEQWDKAEKRRKRNKLKKRKENRPRNDKSENDKTDESE